jgi:hypothetical protein
MLKKWFLMFCALLTLLVSVDAYALKQKTKQKKAKTSIMKSTSKSSKKKKRKSKTTTKYSKKKGKKGRSRYVVRRNVEEAEEIASIGTSAPRLMIAQNKEKSRLNDSVRKTYFTNPTQEVDEGFFAASFAVQKKTNTLQTLQGTASAFKSLSGWDDKKFYILTNELPVGTIVRVTTSESKSICAKVINVLPEMGNAIQYRLSDAAVAILGITSKTFPVSVTY